MYLFDSSESGFDGGGGAARGKRMVNGDGGKIDPMVYEVAAIREARRIVDVVERPRLF